MYNWISCLLSPSEVVYTSSHWKACLTNILPRALMNFTAFQIISSSFSVHGCCAICMRQCWYNQWTNQVQNKFLFHWQTCHRIWTFYFLHKIRHVWGILCAALNRRFACSYVRVQSNNILCLCRSRGSMQISTFCLILLWIEISLKN